MRLDPFGFPSAQDTALFSLGRVLDDVEVDGALRNSSLDRLLDRSF